MNLMLVILSQSENLTTIYKMSVSDMIPDLTKGNYGHMRKEPLFIDWRVANERSQLLTILQKY